MIIYKIDVYDALRSMGYNTSMLRKNHVLGEASIHNLRKGMPVNFATLNKICSMLKCDVGSILTYVPDYVIINREITQ